MTAVAQKTVLTGCLAPIDKNGLEQLIANGKANPKVIKTLKCKTVAEGKFRHANYIRNLAPYIVDEPPGLLGDDTAPNPSEASLAALGSCLAVGLHANAVHAAGSSTSSNSSSRRPQHSPQCGAPRRRQREPVGFTDVRVKVDMDAGHSEKPRSTRWWPTSSKWSPVANTFTRPVNTRSQHLTKRDAQQGCGRRSMGSLALSRVEATDRPAPTIADEVARIARQELAPLAGAIVQARFIG